MQNTTKKLSVAMITFNEERNLARTLNSVSNIADEIVIVDSGSTDKTQQIALDFGANFIEQKWLGYGKQRNIAFENCTSKWILCIDADEEVSLELAKKIKEIVDDENIKKDNNIKNNKNIENKVYEINRISICFGKILKYGGWGSSYAMRLFLRGCGKFNDNVVHESFETNCKISKLSPKYSLYHHSYLTMKDYFDKFNRYTTEGAIDYYKKGKRGSIFNIVFNPLFKFIKMYIIRLGFLDGVEGFMIAYSSSLYTMTKYFKLREIYKNNSYIE